MNLHKSGLEAEQSTRVQIQTPARPKTKSRDLDVMPQTLSRYVFSFLGLSVNREHFALFHFYWAEHKEITMHDMFHDMFVH